MGRSQKKCQVTGCKNEHHAQGFCSSHYKKYVRYNDPTAGRFNKPGIQRPGLRKENRMAAQQQQAQAQKQAPQRATNEPQFEPEPLKDMSGDGSYLFFLNQTIIKRLYGEIYKSMHEPLYMAANAELADDLLMAAMKYAGYRNTNKQLGEILKDELRGYVQKGDKVKFMYTLATWEQKKNEYKKRLQEPKQLQFMV